MDNGVRLQRREIGEIAAFAQTLVQRWFPVVWLMWVAGAGAVWYVVPAWGPWAIAVAAVPGVVYAALTSENWRATWFDLAVVLFLVSAGVSLAAAYDPNGLRPVFPAPIGREKLWGLILAALLFYALVSLKAEEQRRWAVRLLSGFGAAVAVWFLTTNDWTTTPVEFGFVSRMGQLVQSVLPNVAGHQLNPNVAGGLVALTLMMNVELVAAPEQHEERKLSLWRVWGLASALVMGLALVLSGSRGAWLGFLGALCLTIAWWLAGIVGGARRVATFLGFVAAGVLAGGLALASVPSLRVLMLGSEAVANRLDIYYQAALLVRDYVFTGCGLGQFPAVHSTYALMIHVPILDHAHSTALGVAVEQGLPAAATLLATWTGAAWMGLRTLARSERAPAGLTAGLLALAVLVLHSTFDNVTYGSRALLLLWLPAGLIVGAARSAAEPRRRVERRTHIWRRGWWVAAAVAALVGLGILFWRPLAATWQANLGAVKQTQVELRAYDWQHFDDPTLDEVRQQEDLSTAVARFERALALDPGQVTARTRLAQIALARSAYDEGLAHAQAAWETGHRDRVTRLVLGEALVAQGHVDQGASTVRGLDRAAGRFDGQAYYRYWVSEDWQRAAYAWRAVLQLDPENERVRKSVEYAEEKMAQQQ